MNPKQLKIITDFSCRFARGPKRNHDMAKLEKRLKALKAFHYAVEAKDAVMMGVVYEELSAKVKYPELLIEAAYKHLDKHYKGSSTPKTSAIIANYRKRFSVMQAYCDRAIEAEN